MITGGFNNGTTFKNIERLNITTGSGADNIDIFGATGNYSSVASGAGNDIINGSAGHDSLNGGAGNDTLKGLGGYDELTGGAGNDLFVLGDANNSFYGGSGEYTRILDFKSGEDKVQLQGLASNYHLEDLGYITNLYLRETISIFTNPIFDRKIAAFQNVTGLNLSSSSFQYVTSSNRIAFSSGTYFAKENGTAQVTLVRTGSTVGQISVTLNLTNGTASILDYNTSPILVNFDNGETSQVVTIPIIDDNNVEPNETINLTLANPSVNTGLGAKTTAVFTIANDDTNITLAVAPATVNEDDTAKLIYTFTRTGVITNALTVNYGVGGTASLGTDYTQTGAASFTNATGTVTFAAGATTAIVSIDPTVDTTFETNETVALTLASGTGYSVGTSTAVTGSIVNDDTNVTLAVAPVTVTEDGTAKLVYTFTRTGAITNALTVNYNVGGTATFGTDYAQTGAVSFTTTTGTVTFAANVTTATISIDPTAGTIFELDETVALTLVNGTGYRTETIAPVISTISNDDLQPTISIADITIIEGINGNPTQALVTVSLSNASAQSIGVNYATNNLTAIAGIDYTATTGILTFAAGQTSKTIAVPILNDNLNEFNETFEINLTTPTNATIADNKATIVITDTFSTNVTTTLAPLVENLTLTGTANINGTGNSENNIITGNTGNNTLNDGIGNDTLNGNDGNDVLRGGAGSDALDGGAGIDYASYYYSTGSIVADLNNATNNAGDAAGDTFVGIEYLQGSLTAANRLTGDGNNNLLSGYNANDYLSGGGGNDYLSGGAGNDSLIGGDGNDNLIGGEGNDYLSGGEGIDILEGGAGNDSLSGNDGNDVFFGGAGSDILDGGAGIDLASYYYSTTALVADLTNAANNAGEAAGDTFVGIEYLQGSLTASNLLTGDGNNNYLYSYNANDTLTGGAGSDTFAVGGSPFLNLLSAIGVDSITDFAIGEDKIQLSKASFTALGMVGNLLGSSFTTVATDAAAAAATAAIVYNTSNGNLFYNADGNVSGFGSSGGQFANLSSLPTLISSDFTIVA